jgi:MazG family protein
VAIMRQLRAPDGCPWDREQTLRSIQPFTLEEVYEVFDAIDREDWPDLREELGDYLLQAVFYAQIAEEAGHFSIADCLDSINAKLIRRHPHVFGGAEARTAADVTQRWEEIKRGEKPERTAALLDGVSRAQPALAEAQQIAAKASKVGFDWQSPEPVIGKIHEELAEIEGARQEGSPQRLEDEVGDLLFAAMNLARLLGVNAEQALRKSNAKFRRRFGFIEASLNAAGKSWNQTSLDEMEELWSKAKTSPSAS